MLLLLRRAAINVTWREYHEATKHTVERLRRNRHVLDWENMPDPFRHYEGAPLLDLPADPPSPGTPARDGPAFLSQLLFYSAAISASKRVASTGSTYALRVNPSSGNLHPTEFHFITRGLLDWPDGLYHYRPSSHMAEQRATGQFATAMDAPIVFVLASIAWREAWKYRDRAYRYCLLDIGHAWQSLASAAQAMGCETLATGSFVDDEVAQMCRLNEDEWPMLMIGLSGGKVPVREPESGGPSIWFAGKANSLSNEVITYPSIERIHAATAPCKRDWVMPQSYQAAPEGSGPFGEIVRQRRSALDFIGGAATISLAQLEAILDAAYIASTQFIQLYLYAHRIDDLESGVYRHTLEKIKPGDQRIAAAGLSLGQDLAGNACVAFSMIADLDRATREHGDRGYRYAHFEAGAVGHRLYLAAETHGLRATGIGAFYDDEVHRYLDLTPEQGQVIYHFAIGYAVPDPRLEA